MSNSQEWDWRKVWRDTYSGGEPIAWIVRLPDCLLLSRSGGDESPQHYFHDPIGIAQTHRHTEYRLLPIAPKEEWRAWESLEEFVADGAHEMWFGCSRASWKPSCLCEKGILFGDGDEKDAVPLQELYEEWECSPSPVGPFRPCGRRVC